MELVVKCDCLGGEEFGQKSAFIQELCMMWDAQQNLQPRYWRYYWLFMPKLNDVMCFMRAFYQSPAQSLYMHFSSKFLSFLCIISMNKDDDDIHCREKTDRRPILIWKFPLKKVLLVWKKNINMEMSISIEIPLRSKNDLSVRKFPLRRKYYQKIIYRCGNFYWEHKKSDPVIYLRFLEVCDEGIKCALCYEDHLQCGLVWTE